MRLEYQPLRVLWVPLLVVSELSNVHGSTPSPSFPNVKVEWCLITITPQIHTFFNSGFICIEVVAFAWTKSNTVSLAREIDNSSCRHFALCPVFEASDWIINRLPFTLHLRLNIFLPLSLPQNEAFLSSPSHVGCPRVSVTIVCSRWLVSSSLLYPPQSTWRIALYRKTLRVLCWFEPEVLLGFAKRRWVIFDSDVESLANCSCSPSVYISLSTFLKCGSVRRECLFGLLWYAVLWLLRAFKN